MLRSFAAADGVAQQDLAEEYFKRQQLLEAKLSSRSTSQVDNGSCVGDAYVMAFVEKAAHLDGPHARPSSS